MTTTIDALLLPSVTVLSAVVTGAFMIRSFNLGPTIRMAVGKMLGDLFPATKRARNSLSFIMQEPTKVQDTYVVEIKSGKILGFQEKKSSSSSAICFRGVPFATARRLENPQPVESWKESGKVRPCLRFGPACPQNPFLFRLFAESFLALLIEYLFPPLPQGTSYWYGEMKEDCLNANIYTPRLKCSDDSGKECKRPVLVWIHGGAFAMGSNIEGGFYNASSLAAEHDVVVVSINYRLGPFGFLHFPEHGITNLGIRDQIAGLEWVRENVASFGGDPLNVTIIGVSAGGMSVGTLLGCPKASGLFHRAVAMSGGPSHSHSERQWKHFFGAIENAWRSQICKTGHQQVTPESFKLIPVQSLINFMTKTTFSSIHEKILGTNQCSGNPTKMGKSFQKVDLIQVSRLVVLKYPF